MIPAALSQEDIDVDDEDDEDRAFLAEILAEEQREAEELTKLEAEMKELEQLKAQHEQMHQNQNTNKMHPGKKKMIPDNGGNKTMNNIQEELRKKEAEAAEAAEAKRTEQGQDSVKDEAAKKKAEEIARKREVAYQAELERMQDDTAKKALQRQKRRDGQAVKRILRNSENGRHYAVLGLKCKWGEIKLGPFKFCTVSPGEVNSAYRNIAKAVHPDKNRDGRAGEAFDALEKSAAILMDSPQKKAYDAKLKKQRKQALDKAVAVLHNTWRSLRTIFKLLGPFATPIAILAALLI